MPQYVAFLRAINVGGRTVKKEILREIFEESGFINVDTYLQSGNVIFQTDETNIPEMEARVEAKLHATLGYEVPTFIRTRAAVIALAKHQPFGDVSLKDGTTLYVSFLRDKLAEDLQQAMHALSSEIDEFRVYTNHVFWLYHRPLGESGYINADIEKTLGGPATRRNTNTLRRIVKKYFPTN
ncbi:MAG: DUF1697 domain-containing protein [Anaerolineales bacterium]|nr:DUF1697 domain-containing protein [Anaerolineales bacterium]